MAKKIVIISFIITALLILALFSFWVKNVNRVTVAVTSKDSRVTSVRVNQKLFSHYINSTLKPSERGLWISNLSQEPVLVYPKDITVILTDKPRIEDTVIERGKTIFGSAASSGKDVAIIYIWADDSVYQSKDRSERITDYVLSTILYYQNKGVQERLDDKGLFGLFMPLIRINE